jgi:hypothetical protein
MTLRDIKKSISGAQLRQRVIGKRQGKCIWTGPVFGREDEA